MVERRQLAELAAYYRAHPADDRFTRIEGIIEAAPLVVSDFGGFKASYKPKDPTTKVFLEKRDAQIIITVATRDGLTQNVAVRDAVRWKLVDSTEKTVEVTESSSVLNNGTRTSIQQQLEVQALAKAFKASIVLFTSRPADGVTTKDMIVEVVSHGPAELPQP